jgi:hypothetical protein
MKLYTRLIESGIFIFWSEDEKSATFNLKIRIAVGDKKVTLVDMSPTIGQNYYTFDRVGSGEYEIELNAFENDKLYQTEMKNIKINSPVERAAENFHTLLGGLAEINENIKNIQFDTSRTKNNIIDLYNLVLEIKNVLTDPRTIVSIERQAAKLRRQISEFEDY